MPAKNARSALRKAKRPSEPMIRKVFRANLRNRRVELSIFQRQLGDAIGVSQSWIQQLESEKPSCYDVIPNLFHLASLAEALHCLPADLLMPDRFKAGIAVDADLRSYRGTKISLGR